MEIDIERPDDASLVDIEESCLAMEEVDLATDMDKMRNKPATITGNTKKKGGQLNRSLASKRKKNVGHKKRACCKKVPVVVKHKTEILKETICIAFNLCHSHKPKTLWSSCGVAPSASIMITNKSPQLLNLLVKQKNGKMIVREVHPKSMLSLFVTQIVSIEVECCPDYYHSIGVDASNKQPTVCIGELQLHLFIPICCTRDFNP